MGAALYSFAVALLVFALSAEAVTGWLKMLGIVLGVWLVFTGVLAGWMANRH